MTDNQLEKLAQLIQGNHEEVLGIAAQNRTELLGTIAKNRAELLDVVANNRTELLGVINKNRTELLDVVANNRTELLDMIGETREELLEGIDKVVAKVGDVKSDVASLREETHQNFATVHVDLRGVKDRLKTVEANTENLSGVTKEVDYVLSEISAIKTHVGMTA